MKRKTVILILSIFGSAGYALSQSGAGLGSISGVVLDASKAAVPSASVVVANEAKGIRRNLETNSQGVFTAPALIPAASRRTRRPGSHWRSARMSIFMSISP